MCPPLVCPSLVSIQAIIPTQEKIKKTNRGRQQTANWLTIPIHKFPGAQVVDQISRCSGCGPNYLPVLRREHQWTLLVSCLLFPSHAMSTVFDQDIDNNNCIQEYRQFMLKFLRYAYGSINITHIRDIE
jgi:hypothetical protein